jgi:type III secretion protein C
MSAQKLSIHTFLFKCIFFAFTVGSWGSIYAGPAQTASVVRAANSVPTDTKTGRPSTKQRAGIAWPVLRFSYRADGKKVADVMQDFAASQGLPLVIAEGIEGIINGNFDSGPEEFLDGISKAYGLLWYHDGTALYVYPSQDIQSRIFRLKGVRRKQVTELLESLRLGDRRYPLRFDASEQTLFVFGPPRHVELVAAAIEQLDAGASEKNRRVVRVIPLRFASAGDRTSGQTQIPGLAAILNDIYANSASPRIPDNVGVSAGYPSAGKARPMPSLMNSDRNLADLLTRRPGEQSGGTKTITSSSKAGGESPMRSVRTGIDDDEAPIFRADEGTNSILVLGKPQRMQEYTELIRRLDLKPVLIELEATIIDVSSDSIDSLGINWQVQGARTNIGVATASADSTTPFQISTLWSNAGRELLARIDVLTARGKANVVARPKVLGVANRPAVMKDKRTVAVKVTGSLEANLYQLEAGTLLQMTPYVIATEGESRIRLSIYIEDGSFDETMTVDGIPALKRMEISTEAHVLEGESLLIGGITTSVDASRLNAVPGLSKIPFFGGLFRSTSEKKQRSERMFLITPRVVRDIAHLPAQTTLRITPSLPEVQTPSVTRIYE